MLGEFNGPGFKQRKTQLTPKGLVGITTPQCRPDAITEMSTFSLYLNIYKYLQLPGTGISQRMNTCPGLVELVFSAGEADAKLINRQICNTWNSVMFSHLEQQSGSEKKHRPGTE